jgi:HK97 family phage portal protein
LNLFSSMIEGAFSLRADATGTPAPWDDYWYERGGRGSASSSGMRVSSESAKRLSTVWACLAARGRIPGTMPCKIYTDVAGGGKKLVKNHPVYKLLGTAPNSVQTPYEFFEMLQGHIDLRGNAYCEKQFGSRDSIINALIPMHPDRVRVEILTGTGALRYIYSDPLTNTDRTLVQEEVFHPRAHCDGYGIGQSRISASKDVLGVALALQDYHAKFLKNDATPNTVITGTKFANKQDEDAYKKAWQAAGTGENRHKVKILPPGIDVKSIGISLSDMQALDAEKASDVRICTMMGVLPHVVGVDAGKAATYASVEQFNIMHAVQCGLPIVVMWEQAIWRDLIDDEDYFAKFSMASLLRGDQATRYAAYAVAVANGWMSQDDIRELEDLNPIPNGWGKNYWRPLNWAPLQQLTNPTPPAPKALPPPADGNDEDDENEDDEDGSGGQSGDGGDQKAAANAAAKSARLEMLASSAANRCVRREVAGVRKMVDREATSADVALFYVEQQRFTVEVLHLDAGATLRNKIALDQRANSLSMLLGEEDFAAAKVWIDQIAVTEPEKLAKLAVEGAK